MKLSIQLKIPPMQEGPYAQPLDWREVYIDGVRCPPSLEEIILAGVDALAGKEIERMFGSDE